VKAGEEPVNGDEEPMMAGGLAGQAPDREGRRRTEKDSEGPRRGSTPPGWNLFLFIVGGQRT
jgi:hypothetical protein